MILGLLDIVAIATVIATIAGLLVVPLYMLYNSLSRSFSTINREIGELTKDVEKESKLLLKDIEQNTEALKEMKASINKLIEKNS